MFFCEKQKEDIDKGFEARIATFEASSCYHSIRNKDIVNYGGIIYFEKPIFVEWLYNNINNSKDISERYEEISSSIRKINLQKCPEVYSKTILEIACLYNDIGILYEKIYLYREGIISNKKKGFEKKCIEEIIFLSEKLSLTRQNLMDIVEDIVGLD